ncbi:hypothetical protein LCGC14_2704130 [marine sediment metagenome]|uniref:Uncharacterized protein n=1 Tax=marine sediment metagenome TaxID=412755 RepID=A0A0F8ZEX1_9ZZZZ
MKRKLVGLLVVLSLLVVLGGCTQVDPGFAVVQTSAGVEILVDVPTGAIAAITFEHSELHSGLSYTSDFVDEAMGIGDTIILVWKTPSAPTFVHAVPGFTTLVGGDLVLWENPTWTTGTGNLNPILNRRRDSANVSTVLEDLTATPAFTATDNLLANVAGLNTGAAIQIHRFHAWGKKDKLAAGGARDTEEWILNPDTQYALVYTADANNNKAQVIMNWYESTE